MSVWRPLERDEPVGVVALSGPADPDRVAEGTEVLRSWGHPVVFAPNVSDRAGYLAGSDDARMQGLEELIDRGVRLLVAVRGGFGATRLMDRIPWTRMATKHIRFIGFSDLTAVLNPLAEGAVQIHGPMVASGLGNPRNAARLKTVLEGGLRGAELFKIPSSSVIRGGRASGVSVGGNLTLISSLMGTPWEIDFDGKVLFLEEVAESPYRLDRLLTQLRSSASFKRVKALIGGRLHACRPASECAARWSKLLLEMTPAGTPVVTGLPFGHGAQNMAFPIGATVEVNTARETVIWSE
jgi:muramoyltetrapeptide carboxypeptidase